MRRQTIASENTPGAFYGRRVGKGLTAGQKSAIELLLPRFRIDLTDAGRLETLLPAAHEFWLEIGFGCGEHLIANAGRQPQVGFIGVEPFANGMSRMLADLVAADLGNVRVFDADAALLLDALPASILAGADLFYPDPWPKRRHWKRRFVRPDNLDRLWRVIRPGGAFRFASDVADYVGWTLAEIRTHGGFAWIAETADDWRRPYPHWPGTRYEAKALQAGRVPSYLTFQRLD